MGVHARSISQSDGGGRAVAADVVRGFALLGIILVNAPFFAFDLTATPEAGTVADELVRWSVLSFATGKFFLIFSFLFGFGFAVLLGRFDSAARRFEPKYVRRLVGLFVFGVLHAVFLFFGDILVLYALLGFGLWLLRDRSDRMLLTVAGLFMALSVVTQSMVLAADFADTAAPRAGAGYLGGFWEVTAQRIVDLPQAAAVVGMFNGPAAFAMFLLGYVLTRRAIFPFTAERLRRLRTPAIVAGAVGAIGSGVAATAVLGMVPIGVDKVVGAVALSLLAPLLSFAMVVGVHAFGVQRPTSPVSRVLALVGRYTLTGYLLHSVLLGAVFFGWGFGLYGSVGQSGVFSVALLTFAAIVTVIRVWGRWFRSGPAEWLLRSFVDLRWKPLLHTAEVARPAAKVAGT
jgi:uncharacterized protein